MDYFKKQQSLQTIARSILDELQLIDLLGRFGTTHIVGSLALGLMDKEDIDIIVISEEPQYKDYLLVVEDLFSQENIYGLNLQDFRKSIYPDRPQGIYCGASYLIKPDIFWKIDIWFFSKKHGEKSLEGYNWVKSRLNEDNKHTILKIKTEMRKEYPNNNEIGSIEVYRAVLEESAKTIEDFQQYLKKEGKVS